MRQTKCILSYTFLKQRINVHVLVWMINFEQNWIIRRILFFIENKNEDTDNKDVSR